MTSISNNNNINNNNNNNINHDDDIIEVFTLWLEHLETLEIDNRNDIITAFHWISYYLEYADEYYLNSSESHQVDDDDEDDLRYKLLFGKLIKIAKIAEELLDKFVRQLLSNNDPNCKLSALRLCVALLGSSSRPKFSEFIFDIFGDDEHLEMLVNNIQNFNSQDPILISLAGYASHLLFNLESRLVADQLVHSEIPKLLVEKLQIYSQKIFDSWNEVENSNSIKVNSPKNLNIIVFGKPNDENLNPNIGLKGFDDDHISLLIFIVSGCLVLIALVANKYLDVLGIILQGNLTNIAIKLSKSDLIELRFNAMYFLGMVMVHKKTTIEFVELGGFELLKILSKDVTTSWSLSQVRLSMMMYTISDHPQAMELLLRELNSVATEFLVSISITLMRSSNKEVHDNVLIFFSNMLCYPAFLRLFDDNDGIYVLLNVLRIYMSRKESVSVLRNVVETLIFYLRAHICIAIPTEFGKIQINPVNSSYRERSNSLTNRFGNDISYGIRGVRVDDADFQQLQKHVLLSLHTTGLVPLCMRRRDYEASALFINTSYNASKVESKRPDIGTQDSIWYAAKEILHHRGLELLLKLISDGNFTRDNEVVSSVLDFISLLAYEPTVLKEIGSTRSENDIDPQNNGSKLKSGLAIILHAVSGQSQKDPTIISKSLTVLCCLVTPPNYRLQALQAQDPQYQMHDGFSVTKSLYNDNNAVNLVSGNAMEIEQKALRKLTRSLGGIRTMMQVLHYKRIVTHVETIRLGAVQVMLGLALDPQINSILEKIGLASTLTSMLRSDQDHEADLSFVLSKSTSALFRMQAMQLISMISPNAKLGLGLGLPHEAIHSAQERIERDAIVASTRITYDNKELLVLIHNHLLVQGLSNAASALEIEAGLDTTSTIQSNVKLDPLFNLSSPRKYSGIKTKLTSFGLDNIKDKSLENSENRELKRGRSFDSATGYHLSSLINESSKKIRCASNPMNDSPMKTTPLVLLNKPSLSLSFNEKYEDRSRSIIKSNFSKSGKRYNFKLALASPSYFSNPLNSTGKKLVPVTNQKYVASSTTTQVAVPTVVAASSSGTPGNEGGGLAKSTNDKKLKTQTKKIPKTDGPSSKQKLRSSSPNETFFSQTIERYIHDNVTTPAKKPRKITTNVPPTTLNSICTSFFRQQHSQCIHPVSLAPPFSFFKPHVCPFRSKENVNICSVLSQNMINKHSIFGASLAYGANKALKKFVYTRYRSWRLFKELDSLVSCAAFDSDATKVWIGTSDNAGDGGTLRLRDINSGQDLCVWTDMPRITSIVSSTRTDIPLIMTLTMDIEPTGFLATETVYETNLWSCSPASDGSLTNCFVRPSLTFPQESNAQHHFAQPLPAILKPVFSPSVRRIGALQLNREENRHYGSVFDIETGATIVTLDNNNVYHENYRNPNFCFSSNDDGDNLVLTDGSLYDIRTGSIIHRFDKLSTNGCCTFHPNGNSVIIDSTIWDVRNFNLLRSVPVLDGCNIKFNDAGDVLFANIPYSLEDTYLGNKRLPEHSVFHVIDAKDYSDIYHYHTGDKGDVVLLSVQPDHLGLGYCSTVEACIDSGGIVDSVWRLLEIGRRRPSDGDDDDAYDDAESDGDDDEWTNGEGTAADGSDDDIDIDDDDNAWFGMSDVDDEEVDMDETMGGDDDNDVFIEDYDFENEDEDEDEMDSDEFDDENEDDDEMDDDEDDDDDDDDDDDEDMPIVIQISPRRTRSSNRR